MLDPGPPSSIASAVVVVMVAGALAGCIAGPGPSADTELATPSVADGLSRLEDVRAEPKVMPLNATVNVVLVGFDRGLVDADKLREGLPQVYSPNVHFGRLREPPLRSGLRFNLSYELHRAPTSFAEDLFAQYPSFSEEAPIPNRSDTGPSFLERYDRMYDLDRTEGQVHLVNATRVETWIHEHRDEYGLSFEEPEQTIFVLDSWTNHGLWKDDYYYYTFHNNTETYRDSRNLRAWGGTHDFLFMDYSAAPNDARYDNSGAASVPTISGFTPINVQAPEGTAYNDPPMWHYDGDTATIGKGPYRKTVKLTDRIRHAVEVAVNIRTFDSFTFRPIYSDRFHVNVHLWHDGRSIMPTDNLDEIIDKEALRESLARQIPWANVTVSFDTYVAPEDDPGMARALDRGKAKGTGAYIPAPPILNHVYANWETYDNGPKNASSVMALLFLLEGHFAVTLPLLSGGAAVGGPDGLGWGTITHANDESYLANGRDMQEIGETLRQINAHEVGHYWGFYHAHGGEWRTEDGYEYRADHTWSQTRSVMSYRLEPFTADHFDKERLARAHTLTNLQRTERNLASTYRKLDAAGQGTVPDAVLAPLEQAAKARDRAQQLYRDGRSFEAVRTAIDARHASERALQAAGVTDEQVRVAAWSNDQVHNAGTTWPVISLRAGVAPTGVKFDYRKIPIPANAESVTVRATWTNTPESWGDFFIGWSTSQKNPVVNVGPTPIHGPFTLQGGIHDAVAEGPTDGTVTREFTLDLDRYPLFYDLGHIYAGAGVQGSAVNGDYTVEVLTTFRDVGGGSVPDPVEAVDRGGGELVDRQVRVNAVTVPEDRDGTGGPWTLSTAVRSPS